MSGDTGLTDIFQVQFTTLLRLKLQQQESKLRGRVMEGVHTGAQQASPVQYLGPTFMKTPQGRFAPKVYDEQDYSRRWVMPISKENDQLVDNFDQLQTPIDPKSQLVARVAAAANRAFDDAIIAAATGTSTIGANSGSLTTEPWDTTDFQIAANFGAGSNSVGLTVAKLNEARRILEHYHALDDDKQITLVIGSQQHADLRNQALVSGAEFGYNGGVLVNGEVTKYMGMDIVVSERLQTITDKNSNA
ncbi:MAG TPA: phage capsid protein, partial [Candidatus Bathyarchaeia archaeon]|nr:phage capsid protein [Candidatus Bathyarchaeia archaeon]